jgi:predicted ATPase
MPPLTGFRATFRCLRDVEMDFTSPEDGKPSPFIALVGVNGAGKTTVLEGIAQSVWLFARSRVESLFLRQGEAVELIVGGDSLVRRHQERFEVLLPDGIAIAQKEAQLWVKQPGDPAASPYPRGTLPEIYWAARPASLERTLFIRSGYVPTLPVGKQLERGPARGMSLECALLPDYSAQRTQDVHQWWLHLHWEYPKATTLDRLWAALRPFLGDLVYAGVNPQDHLPWFDDRGTRVSFNELSSGQRRLILLFLEIFMQCGEDGLVLFDEPEAHFHPSWQQMLPDALCQLVPRGQVIVATHAPHIVEGRPAHQVFVLGPLPWRAPAW